MPTYNNVSHNVILLCGIIYVELTSPAKVYITEILLSRMPWKEKNRNLDPAMN